MNYNPDKKQTSKLNNEKKDNDIKDNDYNNDNTEQISTRNEKKIIIYLIVITLILLFIAQFFIHNIVIKGTLRDTKTAEITYPEDLDLTDDTVIDYTDRFIVTQGVKEWRQLKELDMFRNSYFHDEAIIAPGVMGNYSFSVENESTATFNYNIDFKQENPYNINMVYKLKKNGQYVLGNENTWESYTGLNRVSQTLDPLSRDIYTVEWRWEHTDYDTPIGQTYGGDKIEDYWVYVTVDAEQTNP